MFEKLKKIKDFREGIRNLTPKQQLNANLVAAKGQCIGFALAFVALIIQIFFAFTWLKLFFIIVLFFALIQLIIQWHTIEAQLIRMRDAEATQEKLKQILKGE